MNSSRSSSVWRHHDFRVLATGQGLSWLGDTFQPIALASAVVLAGGSAAELGIPMAAAMAGRVLCTLAGGVWGDRLQPVRVMAVADLLRATLAAVLALLFVTDTWTAWNLALTMGLAGAAGAFFHPSFAALKPRLVPEGEQQRSNASLALVQTGCHIAGPVLGGLLVATFGAPWGFAVNAATYVWSAVCVMRVRVRPSRAAKTSFLGDLREGLGAVTSRPWLAVGIGSATLYHVANGVLLVLIPLTVVRAGGATALGMTEAAIGAGSLVGGLLARRLRPARPLVTGYACLVVTSLGFLGLAQPQALPLMAAMLAVGFGALMIFGVLWETAIQREVPGHQLARVSAWDQMASFAVFPLGNLLAGPLTDAYGTGPVVVGCVSVLLLSCLFPLAVRDTWRVGQPPASVAAPEPAGMVT